MESEEKHHVSRSYSIEYKQEAVRMLEESGKSMAQLSRELGTSVKNIVRWKQLYGKPKQVSTTGATVAELEAEVRRLRKQLREKEEEREILKKATIFFAMEERR